MNVRELFDAVSMPERSMDRFYICKEDFDSLLRVCRGTPGLLEALRAGKRCGIGGSQKEVIWRYEGASLGRLIQEVSRAFAREVGEEEAEKK